MATDLAGILIVDDNEDNRYTLQLMLESDGHARIASAAGHAAKAGTNTSGAGGLYPSDACGLIVLYNKA